MSINTSQNQLPQPPGPRPDFETFKLLRRHFPRVCVDLWIVIVNDGTLINDNLIILPCDKALLARRQIKPYKSEFYIMGGGVTKGETFNDAVRRKMKAELGLEQYMIISSAESRVPGQEAGPFHIYQNWYDESEEGIPGHDVVLAFPIVIHKEDLQKISLDEGNADWQAIPLTDLAAPDSAHHPNVTACARAFIAQFC